MQDSNYYSRQMSYYEEKIEEAKKEKTNYETLHTILKQLLNGFKLEYSGSGETVIMTNPESGKRVKEGSVVKLMLN